MELQLDSYGLRRIVGDSTGRIDDDANWLYRIILAGQENDTFTHFTRDDRFLIFPSVTWRPNDGTDIRVSMHYYRKDFQADRGWPAIGDRPAQLPRARSLLDPNDPIDAFERFQLNTDINYQLNPDWTLRHRFLYGQLTEHDRSLENHGLAEDGRTLSRGIFYQLKDLEYYDTSLDFIGHLGWGPTEHTLVLGGNFTYGQQLYIIEATPHFGAVEGLEIDIFNPGPSYGVDPSLFQTAVALRPPGIHHSIFEDVLFGLYFQDQITLWRERLHFLVGARYDSAQTGRGFGNTTAEAEADIPAVDTDAFSPRVALLYQFLPILSVYGSYSESFSASNGENSNGDPFHPVVGKQFEAGLKAELLNKRLLATLAVYDLTKTNVLTPDLSTTIQTDSVAVGEQVSRGLEIELAGRITDKFSLVANYAYTDTDVSVSGRGNAGNQFANVQKHAASLWATYDFAGSSILPGLTLGLGSVAVGDREGDIANTFTLPGYFLVDAMASYVFRLAADTELTAQINVHNVSDEYYFLPTGPFGNPRRNVHVGAPRTFVGSIKIEF